jgi:hypothetical protein
MLVQRVPTPVDTSLIPQVNDLSSDSEYRAQKLAINSLDAGAHPFGRQFKVISFRWID